MSVAIQRTVHPLPDPAVLEFLSRLRQLLNARARDVVDKVRTHQSAVNRICCKLEDHLPEPLAPREQAVHRKLDGHIWILLLIICTPNTVHTLFNDLLRFEQRWLGHVEDKHSLMYNLSVNDNRLAHNLVGASKNLACHPKGRLNFGEVEERSLERVGDKFHLISLEGLCSLLQINKVVKFLKEALLFIAVDGAIHIFEIVAVIVVIVLHRLHKLLQLLLNSSLASLF
mmetsp:Transcript_38119/g.101331  ORF Transcript_38119/g.101331 Transcript_38119/m.101331 type:complete len:228 (+) Transcript_38119:1765-2448(+)